MPDSCMDISSYSNTPSSISPLIANTRRLVNIVLGSKPTVLTPILPCSTSDSLSVSSEMDQNQSPNLSLHLTLDSMNESDTEWKEKDDEKSAAESDVIGGLMTTRGNTPNTPLQHFNDNQIFPTSTNHGQMVANVDDDGDSQIPYYVQQSLQSQLQ